MNDINDLPLVRDALQAMAPVKIEPKVRTMKTSVFRIESRWPVWSKWRVVGPAPHSEKHHFDKKGLAFHTWEQAQAVKIGMEAVNAGEFRIVEEITEYVDRPDLSELRKWGVE